MRFLYLSLVLLVVAGCGKGPPEVDLAREWDDSELVVVAEVQNRDGQIRLIAQEVIKGRLGPEVRFSIGKEIGPSFGPRRQLPHPGARVVMFYRQIEGTLMCVMSFFGQGDHSWPVGGRKYDEAAGIDALRKRANQSPEPTAMLGTSAAEQPLVPSTAVAHL